MHNKKYYQYKYLQTKLDLKSLDIQFTCETYNCWNDDDVEKDWTRISFYNNWLNKINNKKNYV